MIHSPPASPASSSRGLMAGGDQNQTKNRNVPVVNGYENKRNNVMRRGKADYYVKNHWAEWCDGEETQLRLLMDHPVNQTGRADAAKVYDAVIATTDFELRPSRSGGVTVMQAAQAPAGREVLTGPWRRGGWKQQTAKAKTGHSPTVRQVWTRN